MATFYIDLLSGGGRGVAVSAGHEQDRRQCPLGSLYLDRPVPGVDDLGRLAADRHRSKLPDRDHDRMGTSRLEITGRYLSGVSTPDQRFSSGNAHI